MNSLTVTVRAPNEDPAEFEIGENPVVIGRDPSCDIHLASQYVSRRHVRVEQNEGRFYLTDLGGTNPVWLNGKRIAGSTPLSPGDTIGLADVTIEVAWPEGEVATTALFTLPPEPPKEEPEPLGLQAIWGKQQQGPGGTLTIMFTDIERSTSIVGELGEASAFRLLQAHNTLLRQQFKAFRGYEAKRVGDGFLVLFASARDAVHCAVAIQRRLEEVPPSGEQTMRVRIGLHVGEVLWDDGDIFGAAVNYAARVSAQAQGAEILISELLRGVIAPTGEFAFGESREVEMKGFRGFHNVIPVNWHEIPR